MPIVTTLHTILGEPNPRQRARDGRAHAALGAPRRHERARRRRCSARSTACRRTRSTSSRTASRACRSRSGSKDQLGVEGKSVILTFGLLSPDKGIEYVIDALPAILARHPDTVYIVLGATHPHVKERHGETYRLMLEHRAQRLGVDASMIFHDRFVSQDELTEFLAAADIYVTPYLNPEQITSGTLAYAVGAGQGGDLDAVPVRARAARRRPRDPRALARPAGDRARGRRPARRRREAARASASARPRTVATWLWPAVARRYVRELRARARRARRPAADGRSRPRRSPSGRPSCPRSTSSTSAS